MGRAGPGACPTCCGRTQPSSRRPVAALRDDVGICTPPRAPARAHVEPPRRRGPVACCSSTCTSRHGQRGPPGYQGRVHVDPLPAFLALVAALRARTSWGMRPAPLGAAGRRAGQRAAPSARGDARRGGGGGVGREGCARPRATPRGGGAGAGAGAPGPDAEAGAPSFGCGGLRSAPSVCATQRSGASAVITR
eukprot:scaffold4482_cov393-Prasinococcus_capsulatus_cf.AAC.1